MRDLLIKLFLVIILIFGAISLIKKDLYTNSRVEKYLNIEIIGEVLKPITLKIVQGTTFSDILDEIELTDDADISNISLNEVLYNNQVISIRKKEDKDTNLISINSATYEELIKLKGIGSTLAKRIIEYRESNGSFRNLDELKNVSGIGNSKYEKIKEFITL